VQTLGFNYTRIKGLSADDQSKCDMSVDALPCALAIVLLAHPSLPRTSSLSPLVPMCICWDGLPVGVGCCCCTLCPRCPTPCAAATHVIDGGDARD
jgi:hypothetical protein